LKFKLNIQAHIFDVCIYYYESRYIDMKESDKEEEEEKRLKVVAS